MQIKEWQDLGIVGEDFTPEEVFESQSPENWQPQATPSLFSEEDLRARGLITTGYHLPYNPNLVERARELRKHMTESEKKLWYGYLRNFKYPVLRQRPIDNFIVDFYCPQMKLVIEIDGEQHYTQEGKAYDEERTQILESYGLRVIRFTNKQVMHDFKRVCETIESIPPQSPLSKGIPPQSPLSKGIPPQSPLGKGGNEGGINTPVSTGIPPQSPLGAIPPQSPLSKGIPLQSPLSKGIPPQSPLSKGGIKGGIPTQGGIEGGIKPQYRHLPIDTRYFKDLELEILSLFDNLDEALDGWLIKSENYQALNTILPKFRERVQTIYIDPPFNTGDDFLYVDRYKDSTWLTIMDNRLRISKYIINKKGGIFLHLDWNANFLGRILLENIFGRQNFRNEIIWAYTGAGTTPSQFPRKHDTILWYSKSEDVIFNSDQLRVPYKKSASAAGRTSFTGKTDEETLRKIDERGKLIEDWWADIGTIGYAHSEILGFDTQKPERLLMRILICNSSEGDLVMDFFLGSGTTTAVAHKLGRKWIGVEMGEHFYTVVLPRMKRVLFYDKSGISKEKDVQERYNAQKAGGFFKYYELEQYEDTLRKARYLDNDLFTPPPNEDPIQYLFLRDLKMLEALEVDLENGTVQVDLSKLYPDIDLAETLSNLTGKWIKRITRDEAEFEDGTKVNLKNPDWKLIKPLIWW